MRNLDINETMKLQRVLENNFVLMQEDGTLVRFGDNTIVRFHNSDEARAEQYGDTVVSCDQLPEDLKKEVIEQIWK